MALNYSQILKNEVVAQKGTYIQSFFTEASSELNAFGLGNNVYFRDLYFDIGIGKILEVSTGNIVDTLPLEKQFLYFPQGVQLLIRGYDYNYYP